MAAETGPAAPGGTALLIIDMMNDLTFEGAEAIRAAAQRAAAAILTLRRAAHGRKVPVIYVNDNHGQWHSERSALIDHALRHDGEGQGVVDRLRPHADDFFVIKPQFSGFYATSLPVLLPALRASRLILTGIAADICVLFTAADAHMRDYDLWIPGDTVASESDQRTAWALEIMRNAMRAETRASTDLSLDEWLDRA